MNETTDRAPRPTASAESDPPVKVTYTRRYALYGALFGCLFPLGSSLFDAITRFGEISFEAIRAAQTSSALHWVINSAPLFLGLFASFAGRKQDKLVAAFDQLHLNFKRLEETMAMVSLTNEQLVRAGKVKSQFLANMSHELRTPLNAIIGFTRIVLRKSREALPERQVKNLETVLDSGEQLLAMVNDLLDLERIEAGMVAVTTSEVEAGAVVQEVASRFKPAAEAKGLSISAIELQYEIRFRTDPVRLRQILDNLVNNAIKYSDKGHIELSVERWPPQEQGHVRFTIKDQGLGIAKEQHDAIFGAFYQVDGSATRSEGGVGLGLHLVKKLTELLNGSLQLESQLGVGSSFMVSLPAPLEKAHEKKVIARGGPSEVAGQGHDILIIDDDPGAAEITQVELAEAGFRARAALSGEEGLRQAKLRRPDAIVLDILMPGMDGWAVLKALRADPDLASVPVVIATMIDSCSGDDTSGVVGWLIKPVTADDFRNVFTQIGLKPRDDVLVVEDHPATLSMIIEGLSELNLQARTVTDGEAALRALAQSLPKAMILDLMLPGVDGFDVLAGLRSLPAGTDVPVIVYTAKTLESGDLSRLNTGVVRVVYKNSAHSLDEVIGAVRDVVSV